MHEFILSIVFLSIGSFSSVLIYRLPLMESGKKEINLFYPRSHCPQCKHTLSNKNLIPLISYLLNYGKCSFCSQKISFIYLMNEAIHLLVGLSIFHYFGFSEIILFIFISLISNMFFGLFISEQSSYFNVTPALYSFYGFMVGFFSLWLVNAVYRFFRKKDGIGGGDFILFGGIGALIGPFYLPLVLLFGSLSSLIIYLMLWKKSTSDEIPLGSGLVCGFFVYVFLSFYELMDNLIVL
jgi:leader peptidase (prepilin peptidase)/N-methyltransferase